MAEPPKFTSAKKMRQIMTDYYTEAFTASQKGKKVAWITSGGPVEPLPAMDILPIYPENHGAMIGAAKMAEGLCLKAEGMGYSPDICSYAAADLACAVHGGGPIGGLPRPDMLICCNNICGTVMKWYEVQARYFDIPLFILDTPVCHTEYTPEMAAYVREQMDEYIAFLEKQTGKKMDMNRMAEVGRLSVRGQRLWKQVLDTTTHRPSPMSAFDAFFFLALIVTLRGTQTAVDFYTELLEEMEERVEKGVGVVPHESIRLLWDNLPVWHRVKWFSQTLSQHGACLVADTYTSAWCSSLAYIDEDRFLDSMAQAYARIYLNTGLDQMVDQILAMVDHYQVDGLLMHSNRSCKPYSFGQMDIARAVRERAGIPTILLEADMLDPRSFSEGQIQNRIDAFIEIIRQGRG